MGRLAREEQFSPDEIAIVHVMNRVVRRCFLMGLDRVSGRNYDYRKLWIQRRIEHLAAFFGIDLLAYSILSNHVHLILRSRPDVVKTWDDTQVARRWLMLCPLRKNVDGSPCEPTEPQLNSIRHDEDKLREIRSRLSDLSWWMRLMCQTIAQRINRDEEMSGKVWESRYRAVRLLDESALLACAAYVDLNPIRAAMAQTLEESDFTSVQRRILALKQQVEVQCLGSSARSELDCTDIVSVPVTVESNPALIQQSDDAELGSGQLAGPIPHALASVPTKTNALVPNDRRADLKAGASVRPADSCLAPVHLDEVRDALQILPCESGNRCSDRGFLNMTTVQYIELLDWTARSLTAGKRGVTPTDAPPVWQRLELGISSQTWLELVANFGKLFKLVARKPQVVEQHRGIRRPKRFKLSRSARELLSV